ncbi:MAG: FtsQ-type POTRA domain-containing protein [Oscillospiraceae bacterium]|jgi:cell division protein FtsQ|nr:FtsQ-type POTRA domain-containing protein [Oscillospiraceae bacterium]
MKRRRKKRGSPAGKLAAALVVIILVFAAALFMRVSEIEAAGGAKYSPEELISAARVSVGNNLIFTGTRAAEKRLLALPYIKSAEVRRVFPDRISITVTERSAAARLPSPDGDLLVASDGAVLETLGSGTGGAKLRLDGLSVAEAKPGSAPVFADDRSGSVKNAYIAVLAAVDAAELSGRAESADFSNLGNIILIVDGIRFELGSAQNAEPHLSAMADALGEYLKTHSLPPSKVIYESDKVHIY